VSVHAARERQTSDASPRERPGEGLSVQFSTQRDNLGVMFTFDVGRHLPASLGF